MLGAMFGVIWIFLSLARHGTFSCQFTDFHIHSKIGLIRITMSWNFMWKTSFDQWLRSEILLVSLMFSNFHLIARSWKSISFHFNWNFDNRIGIFLKIHMLGQNDLSWLHNLFPAFTLCHRHRIFFMNKIKEL